jgi:hypothetical protein
MAEKISEGGSQAVPVMRSAWPDWKLIQKQPRHPLFGSDEPPLLASPLN